MDVSVQHIPNEIWDTVIEQTKSAQSKNTDPLQWTLQLSSNLNSLGLFLPSVELSHVLVSYICWENNVPVMWKFLDKALVLNMVHHLLVRALLSHRVVPNRRLRPAVYRLYMELLKRHAFSLDCLTKRPDYDKVMKSIDSELNLSKAFGMQSREPGVIVVEFIFSIVWQLLDASLDDEGMQELTTEPKSSRWEIKPQEMEIDGFDNYDFVNVCIITHD